MSLPDTKALIAKIEALPPERIAEIADFVDFLRQREQQRALTRGAAAASAPSFAAIWDNPDAADYDAYEFGGRPLTRFFSEGAGSQPPAHRLR
jgi:ABC-type glycerol-3-phosphate transport system substrate-binding protein